MQKHQSFRNFPEIIAKKRSRGQPTQNPKNPLLELVLRNIFVLLVILNFQHPQVAFHGESDSKIGNVLNKGLKYFIPL